MYINYTSTKLIAKRKGKGGQGKAREGREKERETEKGKAKEKEKEKEACVSYKGDRLYLEGTGSAWEMA